MVALLCILNPSVMNGWRKGKSDEEQGDQEEVPVVTPVEVPVQLPAELLYSKEVCKLKKKSENP